MTTLQRLDRHVEDSKMIRHEECVEFRRFKFLGESLQMLEIEIRVGIGTGISPSASMQAYRAHKRRKMKRLVQLIVPEAIAK